MSLLTTIGFPSVRISTSRLAADSVRDDLRAAAIAGIVEQDFEAALQRAAFETPGPDQAQ